MDAKDVGGIARQPSESHVSGHLALVSALIEPLVNGHVLVKMFAASVYVPRDTSSFPLRPLPVILVKIPLLGKSRVSKFPCILSDLLARTLNSRSLNQRVSKGFVHVCIHTSARYVRLCLN